MAVTRGVPMRKSGAPKRRKYEFPPVSYQCPTCLRWHPVGGFWVLEPGVVCDDCRNPKKRSP